MTLLEQAAGGDAAAQSELAERLLVCGKVGQVAVNESLACAELLFRMAAVSGSAERSRQLAGTLMLRASWERSNGSREVADASEAEALVLLDAAADAGDELAASLLLQAAGEMSPEAIRLSREPA